MNDKKITVIIPMHNTEEYIERCIRSVINQTYKNLEIIIVNDGSTDDSLQICERLKGEDTRIKIINQENKGVSGARNAGLESATGEYIGFIDSDDFLEKNMYEKLIGYIEKYDADFASARAYMIDRNGILEVSHYNNYVDSFEDEKSILKSYVDGFLTIAVWDKLFKREAIGNIRFDSTVFCEDAKFVLDVCSKVKKVVCTSERLYNHLRRTGNSLTNTSFNKFYMTLYDYAYEKRNEIIKNNPLCEEEAQKMYFNSIFHLIKIYKRDWDRNKLYSYYDGEIKFLIGDMKNFLEENSKFIDPKLVIQAKDIVEILEYRLEKR